MYSVVTLELFDDFPDARNRANNILLPNFGIRLKNYRKPWVAQITGTCPKFGLAREFIKPNSDYSRSNSKGSRGIYISYFLTHGCIYEVFSFVSWRSTDRYFCIPDEDGIKRISKDEVLECLKHR